MDVLKITSLQNNSIKKVVKLRDRKHREESQLTLLEGYRELTRGDEYGLEILECYFAPEQFLGTNEYPLLEKFAAKGIKLFEVTPIILNKIAYRERPEGLIAVAKMKRHTLDDLPIKKNGLYLVAESIEKPGNLGSILRSADAVNIDGLIVCDKCTDIYNPNVIRASTGALFSVPIAEATSEEALKWLQKNGIKTLSATPHTDKKYTDIDMKQAIAIIVGREQCGLSDLWMTQADLKVVIPMLGKIDSLNVATATTILLYEAARQRDFK